MREVIFYKTASGKSPVEEFLARLSPKEAQKVTWVLRLREELPTIPKNYFKKLVHSDDIWEARIVFGSNIFRILGFFDGPDRHSLFSTRHSTRKRKKLLSRQ